MLALPWGEKCRNGGFYLPVCRKLLYNKDILITSDNIVWLENKALGKPKDENEAYNMLSSLSGKTHKVITSISIKTNRFQKIISDVTKVSFKQLSDEEINYYIKNAY